MNRPILAAIAVLLWCPLAAADTQPVVVKPVFAGRTTASGQALRLPQGSPEVVVSTYQIAPGSRLPVHKHPSPRYAYVLSGVLRVANEETGSSQDYRPGDFIVEAIDQWHFGVATSTEPVVLLVIDQVESGKPNTILKSP